MYAYRKPFGLSALEERFEPRIIEKLASIFSFVELHQERFGGAALLTLCGMKSIESIAASLPFI